VKISETNATQVVLVIFIARKWAQAPGEPMPALINSFLLVVVGEMGDKTQLLAMAMAGKYKARHVMLGVLFATVLNHGLAVLVGSYLGAFLPMVWISIAAGVSFVLFGLWSIRGDSEDGINKPSRWGPVVTVGIAFFLAEMGDKTQLMTITLAAEYRQPIYVLMGTTLGMVAADGLGVFFGAWICKHLPQTAVKWAAGLVFIFFGTLTLYQNIPADWVNLPTIVLYGLIMGALIYLVGIHFARHTPQPCDVISEREEAQAVHPVSVESTPRK
jgi:putative Ca2+/H+ antiporter (TMEM165/GDT1 family)